MPKIKFDWSILGLVALLTFSLQDIFAIPGTPEWMRILFVLVFVVAIIGAICAHELSHAFVAKAFGARVREITFFLFGGATQI